MKRVLIVVTCAVLLSACQQNGGSEASSQTSTKHSADKKVDMSQSNDSTNLDPSILSEVSVHDNTGAQMTLTGQVAYQTMEGGFWGFIDNKGNKYTPMNLKPEFRQNGLLVRLTATEMKDMMTTTQFGTLIKVHELTVIDDSKVTPVTPSY